MLQVSLSPIKFQSPNIAPSNNKNTANPKIILRSYKRPKIRNQSMKKWRNLITADDGGDDEDAK